MGDFAFGNNPLFRPAGLTQFNVQPSQGASLPLDTGFGPINFGGTTGGLDTFTSSTGLANFDTGTGGVPSLGGGGMDGFLANLTGTLAPASGSIEWAKGLEAQAKLAETQPATTDPATGETLPADTVDPATGETLPVDETDPTGETTEPSVDDRKQAQADAIDFLLNEADDIPSDGTFNEDDLERAAIRAEQSGDDDMAATLREIKDNKDALSALDGDDGDLSMDELRDIKDLIDQGFSVQQLITEGEGLDGDKSTLLEHEQAPGYDSAEDQQAEMEAVKFLRDHIDTYPSDGTYNDDDIRKAAEDVSDPDVKAALEKMADHVDELSNLDGEDGNLSEDELTQIGQLTELGYNLDYLIEEGDILDGDDSTRLLEIGSPELAPNYATGGAPIGSDESVINPDGQPVPDEEDLVEV